MKITAENGKISLKLLKRVMKFSSYVGLTWMGDLQNPIIKTYSEDNITRIEESTEDRIRYVLKTVIDHELSNKIDIIRYYIKAADKDTITEVNSVAVKFPDEPRIIKALLWNLKNKNHINIILESMKALYAFNNPDIDEKVKELIEKLKVEKPKLNKRGEIDNLMEKKPRIYKVKRKKNLRKSIFDNLEKLTNMVEKKVGSTL